MKVRVVIEEIVVDFEGKHEPVHTDTFQEKAEALVKACTTEALRLFQERSKSKEKKP